MDGINTGLTGTCLMVSITVAGLRVLECTVAIIRSGTAALVCRVGISLAERAQGLVVIQACEVGEYLFCCRVRGSRQGVGLWSGNAALCDWL